MSDRDYNFTESALIGQQISLTLLAKLVDRGIILPSDAADVLDEVLLQMEEWQASFPEYQQSFEMARAYLLTSLEGYRAMLKTQPD